MKNILLKVMAVAVVMALGATVAWAQGPAQLTEPSEQTGETVSVTISSAGYSTLYSDKALDFVGTGLTAYIVKVYDGKTMMSEVSDVPAYTGVVLKGEAGAYKIPVVDSSSTDVSANKLIGFLEETELASNDTITYSGLRVLPSTDEVGFAMITDSMTVP